LTEDQKRLACEYCNSALKLVREPGQKREQEALELVERALGLDSRNAFAWFCKGQVFSRLGKRAEALECYEKSASIYPYSPVCWHQQGICLQALGRVRDSINCFKQALYYFGALDSKDQEKTRQFYENTEVQTTIDALSISYNRLFYQIATKDLLLKTRDVFANLGLHFPEVMEKRLEEAELLHDSMRNIGTTLEVMLPPTGAEDIDKSALREAFGLIVAFKYTEAFRILRVNITSRSSPALQIYFATQLLESVPYRSLGALHAQEIDTTSRRERISEAEQLLEEALKNNDKNDTTTGKALNNKAAALIHLADYSETWEDLVQKHLEAGEMLRIAVRDHPVLHWPKRNLFEVDSCLNILAEKLKKDPAFVQYYIKKVGVSPEKGLYLTNLRDLELVAKGLLRGHQFEVSETKPAKPEQKKSLFNWRKLHL